MSSSQLVALGMLGAAFVVVSLLPARLRLPAWVGLILFAVLPWWSYQDHSHWARVTWLPFTPPLKPFDVVGNVLLYVPFGWFLVRRSRRRRVVAVAVAAAALLSMLTETAQIYSHGRFPSATDVVLNAMGSALGAWLGARTRR